MVTNLVRDVKNKGVLTLDSVSVKFPGGVQALVNVSLTVQPGEIVALLGPSGSGKSTLLRAVAGLEEIHSGSISWNGSDLKDVPPHKRGFGFMFQDGQLFTHKDVFGNIEYGLKLKKMPYPERKEKVSNLLEQVGLAGYEKRSVTTLSGGEAQRVALARALAPEPKMLMLDEPLSSLDADLRKRMATDLSKVLRANDTSAILVTHDRDEAKQIADRIVHLQSGKIAI